METDTNMRVKIGVVETKLVSNWGLAVGKKSKKEYKLSNITRIINYQMIWRHTINL